MMLSVYLSLLRTLLLTPLLIPTLIVLPRLLWMIAVISPFPQPQSKDTSKRQDKGKSHEHK
jgi:hypothetical protein